MELVAILHVVENVIQVVEFAAKLILKTQTIQRPASLVEQQFISGCQNDLACYSKALKTEYNTQNSRTMDNDLATIEPCNKCLEVALEIEPALANAKSKESTRQL